MTEPLTILGGGPAGVGTAYYARRFGLEARLYEKESVAGGICRTLVHGGHRFDAGAHRFHDRDPQITQDLRDLLGDQLLPVFKPSKVPISGRFVDFPPTPLDMLFSAGLPQVGKIGLDFVKGRFQKGEMVSFADFAIRNFGRTLANRFLLNYSEKVWGLPADQLSPAVATRRLSGMTLKTLFVEVMRSSRKTNHLDGDFLYPVGGYGRIVEALLESIPPAWLRFNQEVAGFELQKGTIREVRFADGATWEVPGRVLSTLPLTLNVKLLGAFLSDEAREAASKLTFRHIRLIFLRIGRPGISDNASIYIPDPDLIISRVYEPRNRCSTMSPAEETSIVAECPCFAEDRVGRMMNEELYAEVERVLVDLGLIERPWVLDWKHHFLPNAYPVYSLYFEDRVGSVLEALQSVRNLDLLGRNGLFFYSHLHDQLRFGRDYAASQVRQQAGCPAKTQLP